MYSQIVVFLCLNKSSEEQARGKKKKQDGFDGFDAEDASSVPTVVTVAVGQLE